MRPPTRSLVLLTRAVLMLAVVALALSTWAAPALAQGCYGESYQVGYGYATGPAYSTTGPVTYGGPLATVGSRLAYRATHPLAGLRGRFAARRALAGPYGVGAACYSAAYAGGGACYSASYGAPAHYHVAPMAYTAPMSYAASSYAAPASYAAPVPYQPVEPRPCPPGYHWGGFTQSCVPDMQPRVAPSPMPNPNPTPSPTPSPQSGAGAGTLHCPCGDAACNHMLGSCPCTDAGCRCHLPGPGTKVQRP
jgi:hypothetical protein